MTAYNRCVGSKLRGHRGGKMALKRAAAACRKHTKAGRTRRGRRRRSRR